MVRKAKVFRYRVYFTHSGGTGTTLIRIHYELDSILDLPYIYTLIQKEFPGYKNISVMDIILLSSNGSGNGIRLSMTKITWTNCADEMPPDGVIPLIVNDIKARQFYDFPEGVELKRSFNVNMRPDFYRWTRYTDEKWEELNK